MKALGVLRPKIHTQFVDLHRNVAPEFHSRQAEKGTQLPDSQQHPRNSLDTENVRTLCAVVKNYLKVAALKYKKHAP